MVKKFIIVKCSRVLNEKQYNNVSKSFHKQIKDGMLLLDRDYELLYVGDIPEETYQVDILQSPQLRSFRRTGGSCDKTHSEL